MKKLIIFAVALSAVLLLLFYCTDYNFDNPLDKNGTNYLFGDTTGEKEKIGDANGNGISDLFDPKYTVTFYANGGGGSLPPAQTVLKDLSITLPSGDGLSRTGYTFDRWCTTPSGMGTYHDAGSVFTPSLNMSFYARWKLILYTVEFDANGGTVSPTSDTTGEGWKLASLPTPTRSGYTFKGWWTTETTGGDSVTVDWVYNADATVYARWDTAVPYTLTMGVFPTGGGSVSPSVGEHEYGEGTSVPVTATASGGYTFERWAGASSSTSATVNITMDGNKTLIARFQPPEVVVGTLADSRDGKTYKTVKIREQTWMAENLNYDGKENGGSEIGACYNNSAENCDKYGRLYNWPTAMGIVAKYNYQNWNGGDVNHTGICPVGWHIPSDAEWDILVEYAGGWGPAGTKLKSRTGWNSYIGVPEGTDEFGFAAVPGGYGWSRGSGGNFDDAGNDGSWWSATEDDANNAWRRDMHYIYEFVGRLNRYKTMLFSVRCVMDDN